MSSITERYFSPGENMTLRDEWRRKSSPMYIQAKVSVPGRLHFGVLDFSRMAPGLGGGGLGVSTDTVSHTIKITRGTDICCSVPSGRHLIKLFTTCVGYTGNDIGIERENTIRHTHSGFGSNVSFNTAVIAGLNALFGSPFSPQEVWDIVTQNYVENAEFDGKIYFGLDTGVGEACFLYGGLVWVDGSQGQGRYIGNVPTTDLWVVTAVGNRVNLTGEILRKFGEGAALSENTETELVASHFMACEREYGQAFREFFRKRMCPALLRNDVHEVLSLGWDMNKFSNVKVLEGIYRTDVLRALDAQMREQGALYAGMSSAGPGYFVFADNQTEARHLARYLKAHFGNYFCDFQVGRAGSKLSIDLDSGPAFLQSPNKTEELAAT